MKKTPKEKKPDILWVHIREAAPNKMFTDDQRRVVRFLVYNKRIPCAECGRKVRVMWTMICEFRAHNLESCTFAINTQVGTVHPPLTPVCDLHPLSPAFRHPEKKPRGKKPNPEIRSKTP